MSWDTYVQNMLGEGCMYAAFFDLNGNKWAESASPCLSVAPDQIQHVVKGMRSPGAVDFRASGVKLGDRKFLVVAQTDTTVVLKQLGGDSNSKIMACVGLFNQGVCVGASAGGEREKCSRISTEKYTDYLRSVNY